MRWKAGSGGMRYGFRRDEIWASARWNLDVTKNKAKFEVLPVPLPPHRVPAKPRIVYSMNLERVATLHLSEFRLSCQLFFSQIAQGIKWDDLYMTFGIFCFFVVVIQLAEVSSDVRMALYSLCSRRKNPKALHASLRTGFHLYGQHSTTMCTDVIDLCLAFLFRAPASSAIRLWWKFPKFAP